MGIKPTRAEMEDRIEFTRELLIAGFPKGQIKRQLREKFGEMSRKTCENYISRASKVTLADMNSNVSEQRAIALERYESIFSDPDATPIEKIKAQERIDRICGSEAAHRSEISGAGGKPIAIEDATERLTESELRAIVAAGQSRMVSLPATNGNGHHNGHNGNGKANGHNGHNGHSNGEANGSLHVSEEDAGEATLN